MIPAEFAEWRGMGLRTAVVVLRAPGFFYCVCASCEIDVQKLSEQSALDLVYVHNVSARHAVAGVR